MAKQNLSKKERQAKDFIELSLKSQDQDWMKTSNRLLDMYQGKYFNSFGNKPRFVVNTIFSVVNLLLPNFAMNIPYVRVKPMNAKYFKKLVDGEYMQIDNIKAGRTREAALNHRYRKIDGMGEQRKAVFDSFFYSFGITKVGYSFDTITTEDKDYVVKDSPFLKRVNPKDFGWHPLATSLDDSPKLTHRVLTSKSKLKDTKRFSNLDEIEPEIPTFLKKRFKNSDSLKDHDFITTYEIHDQENDEIYTFGGEEKVLIEKMRKNPYDFDGSHFQMIKFAGDNDNFIGIPLLGMIEDEAVALNEIMTLMVEHFRKFPGQVFYEQGSIDEDDVERIRNGQQGSIHGCKAIDKIKFQSPLAMGNEYFNIPTLLQNLLDKVLGIPDFTSVAGSRRKSATEASYIQGDTSVRRDYFAQIVKTFMLDGIKKVAALQAQYQDQEEEILATGELQNQPFKYDKSDLQGDYQFDFDIDSLRAFNQDKVNNLNNALQILSSQPVLQPMVRTIDPEKAAKQIFGGLGLNIESLRSDDGDYQVFNTPERENKIARDGKSPMPAPKEGEDHQYHMRVHGEDLMKNGKSEQIIEHMSETMILMQREEAEKKPMQMPPPGQNGQTGAEAQAPQGPTQETAPPGVPLQ